jgi:MerR family copper efflux transcriptional regulator
MVRALDWLLIENEHGLNEHRKGGAPRGRGRGDIAFLRARGLLEKPPRLNSGYRAYPAATVNRVLFIKRAKELGFSLKEIKELLALRFAPGATCGHVKKRAEAKIEDIEGRIKTLQRMKRALRKLSDACGGKGSVSECPILDTLDEGKKR